MWIGTVREEMRNGLSQGNTFNVENGIVKESLSSLTLNEFWAAVSVMCEKYHKKCTKCSDLFDICSIIEEKKLLPLKDVWLKVKGAQKYSARYAERLVVQVPCATLRLVSGGRVYVMEKVRKEVYMIAFCTV